MGKRMESGRAWCRVVRESGMEAAALALALAVGLGAGCLKETENKEDPADVAAVDQAAPAGDAAGGSDTAVDAGPLPAPVYAPICGPTKACPAARTCFDGVCVPDPTADQKAQLTDPLADYKLVDDAIALGCVGQDLPSRASGRKGPDKVVLWGRVDRFGGGAVTVGLEVAVFRAADFKPWACAGLGKTAEIKACYRDAAKVGQPLATVVSIDPDQAAKSGWEVAFTSGPNQECARHLDCPLGYDCLKDNAAAGKTLCKKMHGVYAIEGVPTNQALILRVRTLDDKNPEGWHDSYLWNAIAFADRLDPHGAGTQPAKYVGKDTVRLNPTVVGEGQWQLVPATMGLDEISEGNAAVGGRIRDCGLPAGRRAWPITNAKVNLGKGAAGIAFFNDTDASAVPVKTRTATDVLGRYAVVDVEPGPNRIAAAGQISGKTVSLGSVDLYVIPDALIIASFPGAMGENTK